MKTEIKKTLNERIEILLRKYPELRESDNRLMRAIWQEELKPFGLNLFNISAETLLDILNDNSISSPFSISRARRNIQKENTELKPKDKERRKEREEEVKGSLGYTPRTIPTNIKIGNNGQLEIGGID